MAAEREKAMNAPAVFAGQVTNRDRQPSCRGTSFALVRTPVSRTGSVLADFFPAARTGAAVVGAFAIPDRGPSAPPKFGVAIIVGGAVAVSCVRVLVGGRTKE